MMFGNSESSISDSGIKPSKCDPWIFAQAHPMGRILRILR
jgi:hypothetical protein